MKLIDVVSVIVVIFLFVLIVQLSPATGASTRHHHHRRHYRGYRQEMPSRESGSSPNVATAGVHSDATPWPSNCSHCSARLAKRDYRLASIKNEILRKLHLSSPPNITRRQLPDIPPLRDLISDRMVSETPTIDGYGADDFHATTMKIMLFPKPGNTGYQKGLCV